MIKKNLTLSKTVGFIALIILTLSFNVESAESPCPAENVHQAMMKNWTKYSKEPELKKFKIENDLYPQLEGYPKRLKCASCGYILRNVLIKNPQSEKTMEDWLLLVRPSHRGVVDHFEVAD